MFGLFQAEGAGAIRDIDILARMAKKDLVRVCVSITTLDARLARVMEPRAASPVRRLEAVRQLSAAGIPVAVLAAPMIPGINDSELERIVEAAARAGADSAGYVLLRLPLELKQIFEEWLRWWPKPCAIAWLRAMRRCIGTVAGARYIPRALKACWP